MKSEYGKDYAELYNHHWWWRSREETLLPILKKLPLSGSSSLLDVGCGDGLFFRQLEQFGAVTGIEIDTSLLTDRYRDRIYVKPLGDPIYREMQFDLITALDVLEHIEDDYSAVSSIVDMLRPGGFLVVTVPAFMSLWDHHDEINEHFRRYSRKSLRDLIEAHLQIQQLQYLFHALYPLKHCFRLGGLVTRRPISQHRIPAPVVNRTMQTWFTLESKYLQWARLPFGTSLLAIAQKPF